MTSSILNSIFSIPASANKKPALSEVEMADLWSSFGKRKSLLVPAVKGRRQKHQNDAQANDCKDEINDEHVIYDFKVIIQKLINQKNSVNPVPIAMKYGSNLSSITGSITEATKTIPKSAQISENLERSSLPGSCMFIFSIVDVRNLSIGSTAGAFIRAEGAGFGVRE